MRANLISDKAALLAVCISFSTRQLRYYTAMLFLAFGASLISSPTFADPPARVGRIGLVEGDVSFYTDKESGWKKARLNYPVTSKNSVWTNPQSRAEVRIGASALRLDADSIVDFTEVDDSRTQLFVQRGRLNVRLRSYPANTNTAETYKETFRVETNEGTVILQSNGRYRIDAAQDRNETVVAVFAGAARFDNGSAALNIEAGKTLVVRISNGAPSFVFASASESNFDRWAEARDVRWDEIHQRYANERNISPRMTGYEDLDQHGDWTDDREYGRLWTPRIVVSNWAPYRYGSWSYVRPWGWTWVDDAAWGFAPFHYGRWVHRNTRWYWAPGQYHYRPVYAPALVGWAGRGNWNISLSVGGGNVGWFPLAPREHYVPHYSNNVTYIRNINNITNNITVINPPTAFANLVPGGTVVNNGVMVNGEPVWRTASINNEQSRSMVKPTLDRGNTSIQSMQVNSMPPPTPTMPTTLISGRNKPAVLNTSTTQVGGEPPRPTVIPTVPVWNNSRMVVNGEAPRPNAQPQTQSQQNKPAVMPLDNASANTEVPQFARPIKPNPRVATSAPTEVLPQVQAPQTPAQPSPRFDNATPKKPAMLVSDVPNMPNTQSSQTKPNQWRSQPERRAETRSETRVEPRIETRVEGERSSSDVRDVRDAREVREVRQRNNAENQRANTVQTSPAAPQVGMVSPKPSVDKPQNSGKIGRASSNQDTGGKVAQQ